MGQGRLAKIQAARRSENGEGGDRAREICVMATTVLEYPTVDAGPLAQLAEQGTLNAKVRGSSPWRVTRPLAR